MFIRVMTFNINGNDFEIDAEHAERSWAQRADLNSKTIRRYSPDLIGLQEVVPSNIKSYEEHMSDYAYELGHESDEGDSMSHSSIFWKRARFKLVESGKFWFSRTPDVRSSDWGVPYPLGATWLRLQDAVTGEHVLHLNTHFEDGAAGEQSRIESSKLIVARLEQLAPDIPVIVTGDFNCNPWSTPYNIFKANRFIDTYRAAGNADSVESSTYHGYVGKQYFALDWSGEDGELYWRVDWILMRDGLQHMEASSCTIVRDAGLPPYPSDHYPVVSELVVL